MKSSKYARIAVCDLRVLSFQIFNGSEGNFVLSAQAIDRDSGDNGVVRYTLAGRGSEAFVIDPVTGIIRVSLIGVDFETIPENPLTVNVIASDLGI